MGKIRLLNGKPLLVNSKVALSDACCCAGPCPDPCPDPISSVTTGVVITPDCVLSFAGRSAIYSDVNLNGSQPLHLDCVCSPDCTGLGCEWQTFFSPTVGNFHQNLYSDAVCGSLNISRDRAATLFVLCFDGTWYLYLSDSTNAGSTVLFYAETTSISNPIPNACVYTAFNDLFLDNPLLDQVNGDCTPHSGAGFYTGIGKDGTVTLTI